MAAAAATANTSHPDPLFAQPRLEQQLSRGQSGLDAEALWAELYYELPFGHCHVGECGCQRYRIHPSLFQLDQPEASQVCDGCKHDHSFHSLGTETDRVYGMKNRQNLWSFISQVTKRAPPQRNAEVGDSQNEARQAHSAAALDTTKEHEIVLSAKAVPAPTILDVIESMKTTLRSRQEAEIAPARISPKHSPVRQGISTHATGRERTQQQVEASEPVEPFLETKFRRDEPEQAQSLAKIDNRRDDPTPAARFAETEQTLPEPISQVEPEVASERPPAQVAEPASPPKAEIQAAPEPQASRNLKPESQPEAIPHHQSASDEIKIPQPQEPDFEPQDDSQIPDFEPEEDQQHQAGQYTTFHAHQDSAQTVQPFDMSQMSSGNSSPLQPPMGWDEVPDLPLESEYREDEGSQTPPHHVIAHSVARLQRRLQESASIHSPPGSPTRFHAAAEEADNRMPSPPPSLPQENSPRGSDPAAISAAVPNSEWDDGDRAYRSQPYTHERNRFADRPSEFRCYYCNETGHMKRDCPELHGTRSGNSIDIALSVRDAQCPICRMSGHTRDDCPGMERAHLIASPRLSPRASVASRSKHSSAGHKESGNTSQPSATAPGPTRNAPRSSVPANETARHAPAPTQSAPEAERAQPVPDSASVSERPATSETRGRQTTRSSHSSKTISSRKKEPELKIWADESVQPKVTNPDGTTAYVPWWAQPPDQSRVNDGAWGDEINTNNNGKTSFINENSGIPDWSQDTHGPGFVKDKLKQGDQVNAGDSWGGDNWADEVEDHHNARRYQNGAWGAPSAWNDSADGDGFRTGRGRGRGFRGGGAWNIQNGGASSSNRDSGGNYARSDTYRGESGSSGNTRPPPQRRRDPPAKQSQARILQEAMRMEASAGANGAGGAGVREGGAGAGRGVGGVGAPRLPAAWRGSTSGESSRSSGSKRWASGSSGANGWGKSWKQKTKKYVPPGMGSAATHHKRDQRRRKKEREAAEQATAIAKRMVNGGFTKEDNTYDDSQFRMQEDWGPKEQTRPETNGHSPKMERRASVPQSEMSNLIEL